MATTFPTTLDSFTGAVATETIGAAGGVGVASMLGTLQDAVEALEAKLGVTTSAVTASHDYKLTNASSADPGHTHTLSDGASDITASIADLNATTNFEQTLSSSTTVLTVTDGTINFNIASHDGTNGLKLGGTLVTASAAELNYTDGLTAGTATASKLVLLNATKDFNFGTGDVSATDITATGDIITDEIKASTADTPVKISNGTHAVPATYTPAGAATATLDVSNSNIHSITMPAGNITIAISNETVGQCFLVEITQDGTGSRTVTWFTTIKWAGGSAPTLTTGANKRDCFGVRVTGVDTYDAYIVGQNI